MSGFGTNMSSSVTGRMSPSSQRGGSHVFRQCHSVGDLFADSRTSSSSVQRVSSPAFSDAVHCNNVGALFAVQRTSSSSVQRDASPVPTEIHVINPNGTEIAVRLDGEPVYRTAGSNRGLKQRTPVARPIAVTAAIGISPDHPNSFMPGNYYLLSDLVSNASGDSHDSREPLFRSTPVEHSRVWCCPNVRSRSLNFNLERSNG